MKIKILEKTHELDLEDAINDFITNNDVIIKKFHYNVALTSLNGTLEYSFSCMIEYLEK